MRAEAQTYPAIYIIFTLLNAIRRGIERKNLWREFRRQGVRLKPRLAFWLAVCVEAGLIKGDTRRGLQVTGYAREWLRKTAEEQAFHLIEAWQNAPTLAPGASAGENRRVRQNPVVFSHFSVYNQFIGFPCRPSGTRDGGVTFQEVIMRRILVEEEGE